MLITDKPLNLPTTNALDNLPADLLDKPPAYYALGNSPTPMENPPETGEVRTILCRVVCTGERKKVRTDGELRYVREFTIQACWEKGQPEPPNPDDEQPALIATDGSVNEPAVIGGLLEGVDRPGFSSEGA